MRKSIPKEMQLAVWNRDNWHCQYCGDAIFFSPSLKLLESMSPGHGYYDQHGKRGLMLKLLEDRCACCDHVDPVTKDGQSSLDNLIAACFSCNRKKSSGSMEKRVIDSHEIAARPKGWDGLASIYTKLSGSELSGSDPSWVRLINAKQ